MKKPEKQKQIPWKTPKITTLSISKDTEQDPDPKDPPAYEPQDS